ncbi:NAD-binding protein, partial [Microbacteriaceae bacterium K1510]|nr:NAD-binding protein [Microbacteriaceae bacterium K1510]
FNVIRKLETIFGGELSGRTVAVWGLAFKPDTDDVREAPAQEIIGELLARGVEVSIIDTDVEMIRDAENFGFKVYYGDGTRLDVLRTSGAGEAKAIAICVNDPQDIDRIVDMCKAEFPNASL